MNIVCCWLWYCMHVYTVALVAVNCAKLSLYCMPYECDWAWYHVTNEYLVSVVLLELLWSHMPSLNCSILIHTCTYNYMAMYIMGVWCTANLHMPQTTLH